MARAVQSSAFVPSVFCKHRRACPWHIRAKSGLLMPSVAVFNGLRRAWLFWHIKKPAFSAQFPIQFSKGKAILFPYDSGIYPAHASKACILLGWLRSSIVLALADIDIHCPCPDSCPWQAMLFASFLLYGLFALPFRACLAGVIPFWQIPPESSSEKSKFFQKKINFFLFSIISSV